MFCVVLALDSERCNWCGNRQSHLAESVLVSTSHPYRVHSLESITRDALCIAVA